MLRVGLVSHNILTKKVLNLNKKLVPSYVSSDRQLEKESWWGATRVCHRAKPSCVAPTPTVGRLFGPHPNGHMVQATVNKDNG